MNVTNEWGANYYVLTGTKELNSINAFTTAPYSNGGNIVFWIALNSQKQWGILTISSKTVTLPIAYQTAYSVVACLFNCSYGNTRLDIRNKTLTSFQGLCVNEGGSTHTPSGSFTWLSAGK